MQVALGCLNRVENRFSRARLPSIPCHWQRIDGEVAGLPGKVQVKWPNCAGIVAISRYLLELLQRGQQFRELGRCGEQLRVQVAGLVELDIEGMGIALLEA